MNKVFLIPALLGALMLSACEKPTTVNVPATPSTPVIVPVVPGPPGAPGATGAPGVDGAKGATGATGDNTTVIVVPPAASSPR